MGQEVAGLQSVEPFSTFAGVNIEKGWTTAADPNAGTGRRPADRTPMTTAGIITALGVAATAAAAVVETMVATVVTEPEG